MATHLGKIAKQWCMSVRHLKGSKNDEKHDAYKGLCFTIARNSDEMLDDFAFFCSAVVHYKEPK